MRIFMALNFKVGDHVEWNSEAGRVRGTIQEKFTSEITFKGYTVHASEEEPQYSIGCNPFGCNRNSVESPSFSRNPALFLTLPTLMIHENTQYSILWTKIQ